MRAFKPGSEKGQPGLCAGLLPRRARANRQRVNPLARNVAKGGVHHPLALKAGGADEASAFDFNGEVRFSAAVVARMAAVRGGIVDHVKVAGRESCFEQLTHFLCDWSCHGFHLGATFPIWKPVRHTRFHGRVESGGRACSWPGCDDAGEFRAPGGRASGFDGPGDYRWLCLEHVRQFNAGYDYFDGMNADEIQRAQSPIHGWEAQSRAFRPDAGIDGMPRWADFSDPLEAISGRARGRARRYQADMKHETVRFTPDERRALDVLGLDGAADRRALRQRYVSLLRRFHPDHNGGDHGHATRLQEVVEAYQVLKEARALV